jgi:transcriptional regulator with XRE-family HTH domain
LTATELRAARRQLGLTQAQLAVALKLGTDGKRSVGRWENGERPISGPVAVSVQLMQRVKTLEQALELLGYRAFTPTERLV